MGKTTHIAEVNEKLVGAVLARSWDRFDAAWGRPFDAKSSATRVEAFAPALRGLPPDAVQWAVDAALATLERHPTPAQLRRLAQASPLYEQLMAARKTSAKVGPPPELCDECGETRQPYHIKVEGAPRAYEVRVIKHQPSCSHAPELADMPWTDPPAPNAEVSHA